jgi:hypothetical protein
MQPYLYPYAGYYRLIAASDVFVLFDDVQFPRRGRVHRCEMAPGRWLTLPLERRPRETSIRDLQFADGARERFDARLARFGVPRTAGTPVAEAVCRHLYGPFGDVVDFLERGLRLVAEALALEAQIVRSSHLSIDPALRGQARVLAIVQALDGRSYLNAPAGRELYDVQAFRRAGIELKFLAPYTGRFPHVIAALLAEKTVAMGADVRAGCRYADDLNA